MYEYVTRSEGPGSIGALIPGAGLRHPATISSNDPRGAIARGSDRILGTDIRVRAAETKGPMPTHGPIVPMIHGAQPIPPARSERNQVGDVGDGFFTRNPWIFLIPVAAIVGFWMYTNKQEKLTDWV
jgi:hypothetical protein